YTENYIGTAVIDAAGITGTEITAVQVENPGGAYYFSPTVWIDGLQGRDARLMAVVDTTSHTLSEIVVLNGGTNYFSSPAPKITIAPPASIQLNAHITSSTVGSSPETGDGRGQVNLL